MAELQPGFQSPSHLTSNLIYLASYVNATNAEPKLELLVSLSDPHVDSLSKDIEGILFLLTSVYQNLVVSSWWILIFSFSFKNWINFSTLHLFTQMPNAGLRVLVSSRVLGSLCFGSHAVTPPVLQLVPLLTLQQQTRVSVVTSLRPTGTHCCSCLVEPDQLTEQQPSWLCELPLLNVLNHPQSPELLLNRCVVTIPWCL